MYSIRDKDAEVIIRPVLSGMTMRKILKILLVLNPLVALVLSNISMIYRMSVEGWNIICLAVADATILLLLAISIIIARRLDRYEKIEKY